MLIILYSAFAYQIPASYLNDTRFVCMFYILSILQIRQLPSRRTDFSCCHRQLQIPIFIWTCTGLTTIRHNLNSSVKLLIPE